MLDALSLNKDGKITSVKLGKHAGRVGRVDAVLHIAPGQQQLPRNSDAFSDAISWEP